MVRSILVNAFLLLGLAGVSVGCSRAQVVCDLVCECEHCSDEDEILTCQQYATTEDVADAYDCGDAWTTLSVCLEEQGRCDEKEARFSTQNEDTNEDRCDGERDALNACIEAASGRDGAQF